MNEIELLKKKLERERKAREILENLIENRTRELFLKNNALENEKITVKTQANFLTNILESVTQPLYVIDVNDYSIKMANSAALQGNAEHATTCHALSHKSDSPCKDKNHPCPIEIIKKTEKPVKVEHVHYDGAGNPRYYEINAFPVFDSENNLIQIIEHSVDITKRRRAELALKINEERLKLALDATNTGLWDWDAKANTTYANDNYYTMLGYEPEEFPVNFEVWEELLHPEDRAETIGMMSKHLKGKIDSFNMEFRCRTKSGGWKWIAAKGRAVEWDSEGIIARVIGTHVDINDKKDREEEREGLNHELNERVKELDCLLIKRKQTEQALKINEERLKLALAATNAGIWDWNVKTNTTYFTDSYYTMLGYEPGEFPACYESWERLLHPEDREKAAETVFRHIEKKTDSFDIEFRLRAKSGTWIWIAAKGRTVERDKSGMPLRVIGMHVDITDRKNREEERERLNHELNERVKELDCLLGISTLLYRPSISMTEIYQGILELIPISWQYPDKTCARIVINGEEYKTDNFNEPDSILSADIILSGEKTGVLEVGYLEGGAPANPDPFPPEEKRLLSAIAERLGKTIERRQTQILLRESENRLKTILDDLQVGIAIIDEETHVIKDINPSGAKIIGAPKDDIIGNVCHKYICPAEAGECPVTDPGQTMNNSEGILIRVDGSEVPILKTCITTKINGRKHLIESFSDISEIKRIQIELQNTLTDSDRRKNEVSALLKGAQAILGNNDFTVTARAIFDYCKDLIGAASGYVALLTPEGDENEVLFLESGGLPCTVDANLPMPIRGLRAEAYRSGKAVFENNCDGSEWTEYLPAGHVTFKNVMFAPLNIEGKPVGLIGLANKNGDFSENDAGVAQAFGDLAAIALKNSRIWDALRESEDNFRSLFESSVDAIMIMDEKGITDCNPAAVFIFGLSGKDELIGAHPSEFSPQYQPDGRDSLSAANEKIQEAIQKGKNEFEWVFRKKNGEEFPAEIKLTPYWHNGRRFIQGNVRDISLKRKMEEEKINMGRLESIQNMIVTLNHEMNQPLSVICSFAKYLLQDLDKKHQAYEDARIIHEEAWKLAELVRKTTKMKSIKTTDYSSSTKMIDLSGE